VSPDMKPDVVFQEAVFKRERLLEKWPHLHRTINSGDEVAAAFEAARRHPMWRDDPRLADLAPGTAREVLDFYNAVITDGRYIAEFQTNPGRVAKRLRLDVSAEAVRVISTVASRMSKPSPTPASGPSCSSTYRIPGYSRPGSQRLIAGM
jgi:hypothetical protein